MDTDKIACAELIQSWGFARDQGHWDDLTAIMHAGGETGVSWFGGSTPDFQNHARNIWGKGTPPKHHLGRARAAVNGPRATAETNVAILVRQTIDGVECDLTS